MKYSKIVYILLLCATLAYTGYRYAENKEDSDRYVTLVLENYSQRLESAFTTAANITTFLAKLLELYGGELTHDEFQRIAAASYNPYLHKSISYIPGGIITNTYPYEENKGAIGLNVYNGNEDSGDDALTAQITNNIVLSGPNNLVQGGNGLIARKPVYITKHGEDVFWGFVSVVLKTNEVIDSLARVRDLEDIGLAFSIRTIYDDHLLLLQETEGFDESKAFLNEFSFGGNQWQFFLYDTGTFARQFRYSLTIIFFGIAISTLAYIILIQIEQAQQRIKDELVRDSLTKLYNRKILEEYQNLTSTRFSKGCTLLFIDLNKFKPVNDNLGHEIGDQLLIAYAGRLKSNFRKDTTIIRMGGDEFAVILDEALSQQAIDLVISKIKALSEKMFNLSGHEVYISASVGYALYPDNGNNITEILEHADKMMYDAKAASGNER